MILDIHTHHRAPQPQGVISVDLGKTQHEMAEGQLCSVGVHPWSSEDLDIAQAEKLLREAASQPLIVAIGECGIDMLKGAPLYKQMLIFKQQIELSEELELPLIIHDVKAHEVILGLHKELKPRQPWVIHGFRYKPTVAQMFTQRGIYLSFGENFNAETLRAMPRELLLAETDESSLSIEQVITNLSTAIGEDLTATIAANTARLLRLG